MKNQVVTGRGFTRRDFLKLAGCAGAAAAGTYLLDAYAPWVNYNEEANRNAQGISMNADTHNQTLEIIRAATLAASGHNTQPWKFAVRGDEIQIHPDYTRRLPVVDPQDRELWISLGCALENLLTAAAAAGLAGQAAYPETDDFISVRLTSDTPRAGDLFAAIPVRQNTRSAYDGRPLAAETLAQLEALPLEPGVELRFFDGAAGLEKIVDYVNQGNLSQYAERAFVDELINWIRFTQKEALATRDGLFSRCAGSPEVPRFIGKMFVAGAKPQAQADADAKKLRSSAGAVVIASASDSITDWVRTGQVYQRLALTMTSLDVRSALLNQPIEAPEIRGQFQSAAGLGTSVPQLLLRFGYAEALPRSLRRPVEQVLMA